VAREPAVARECQRPLDCDVGEHLQIVRKLAHVSAVAAHAVEAFAKRPDLDAAARYMASVSREVDEAVELLHGTARARAKRSK